MAVCIISLIRYANSTSMPEDNGNNEACNEAPDVTLSAFDETVVTVRYFQDPALYKIYAGLADST